MVEDCFGEEHSIIFGMFCKRDRNGVCTSLKVVLVGLVSKSITIIGMT